MAINIPKNNYVQPTEIREEVVQGICDAFLRGCCWSTFHPFSASVYRKADKYIVKHKKEDKFYGFNDEPCSGDYSIRIRGAEMKAAFKELINAGYHIWKYYEFRSWVGYKVTDKPYCGDYGVTEVFEFNDFID